MTTIYDDDDDSTTSHVQRYGLEYLDRRSGTASPFGVPHEVTNDETESEEHSSAKAPADAGSLEPPFLKVAPVGSNRVQRDMALDLRLNLSNEFEAIAVPDSRSLSSGAVRLGVRRL